MPNDVPSSSPVKLNTTYFSDLVPQLYTKYPNYLMKLNCTVVQMPVFTFNTSGIYLNALTHVDFYVFNNQSSTYVFTLAM